jgi:peptidoglycan/LPS O-acetylase OafA/YrhL
LLRLRDSERLAALDALRGAAILLVLGRHYHFDPGWVGVDLFFVLSGFLVSGLLFREYQRMGKVRVGRFLARRGFKIYPAFYAFMLVTAIYMRHTPTPPGAYLAECLFLQGYLPHIWWHTWSLAVEEHFYLLLALGLALIVRRGRGADNPFALVVPVTAIVALAELAARIVTVSRHPGDLLADLYPTHLRLDSLLFGVLLAYWYHFDGERLRRIVTSHRWIIAAASAAAVVLVMAMDVTSSFTLTVGLTLLYLGFGGAARGAHDADACGVAAAGLDRDVLVRDLLVAPGDSVVGAARVGPAVPLDAGSDPRVRYLRWRRARRRRPHDSPHRAAVPAPARSVDPVSNASPKSIGMAKFDPPN